MISAISLICILISILVYLIFFFFSSRRRHTRLQGDWSSDVCSSDLDLQEQRRAAERGGGGPPARRRRRHLRQDERAALPRRLAELQRDLRDDEQSVGRHARARRILGRLGGGARGRAHRAGGR